MNKDFMKKYFDNPNYIQGIYNYCDRWCKKCEFTARCMHYALSEDHFSDPDSKNITNKIFWQKITELFKVTLEMLNDLVEQEDIDMNMFDSKKALQELDKRKEEAKNNECSLDANSYIDLVNKWFNDSEEIITQNEDVLNLNEEIEIKKNVFVKNVNELKENLEAIQWYQYQIYIKINRAVEESLSNPPETNDFQSNYNGSAKVALLGIDRSLLAWEFIMNKFPEKEDEILPILIHLGRLRKKIEKLFPEARGFIRPGFDEEIPNIYMS
jgi:hypothetical protein